MRDLLHNPFPNLPLRNSRPASSDLPRSSIGSEPTRPASPDIFSTGARASTDTRPSTDSGPSTVKRPASTDSRPTLAGDAVLPDPILRVPARPPSFSGTGSSFLPPGHQALQYMHGLLKLEREMRDMHEIGSPDWYRHHRNVELFERFPKDLKRHPGFDLKREHREMERYKVSIRDHNQAVRDRQKVLEAKTEKVQDRLFKLVELRWSVENHIKNTGKPVWGKVDFVPGIDAGDDKSWYSRRSVKSIDIRGMTREGVEKEILDVQQELNRIDRERIHPPNLEYTTPLFPQVEFRGRDEILARAFGEGS